MQRVVLLGRGAAGKSTTTRRLGEITGSPHRARRAVLAPRPDRAPLDEWTAQQRELAAADRWIIDGDLGPYDALGERLPRADTVLIFDFSLARCTWRALHRSRERADFW